MLQMHPRLNIKVSFTSVFPITQLPLRSRCKCIDQDIGIKTNLLINLKVQNLNSYDFLIPVY